MNRAIHVTAAALGLSAGLAGLEHGIFELMQGNVRPSGLMIASIGPPCDPLTSWNACEPALTIIPNLAISGILTMIVSLMVILWCLFFLPRPRGGLVLILLALGLLLVGGGIFPPVIAIIAGLTATRIDKSLTWTRQHLGGGLLRALAKLYPLALAVYLVMVVAQWVIGYLANDWFAGVMVVYVPVFMAFLLLAVLSAIAADIQAAPAAEILVA